MKTKKLHCQSRNFTVDINLPASKSISNRLLIIRALSNDSFTIINPSNARDSELLEVLLEQIHSKQADTKIKEIDAEDAGTVFRFLTAYLSVQKGSFILKGSERMQERPIGILVDALRQLGAKISYLNAEGFPPLRIDTHNLASETLKIQANVSSQFISALLLVAPLLPQGISIQFDQKPSSWPYILMTLQLMLSFGIDLQYDENSIEVQSGHYKPKETIVEADWSSAASWYQCVAFSKAGQLFLKNLKLDSLQGDAILPEIYSQLGVETTELEGGILIKKSKIIKQNITIDFSQHPDLALPIIATCAGLNIIGKYSGLESLKIKESNRINALETELAKLGFDFRETNENEWVLINSCKTEKVKHDFSSILIQSHNDHRIAMSFAPFAILGKGIQIENASVVSKSYPSFWQEFAKLS